MKELRIIAGKDACGKNLDMRITDCKDDDGEPVAWIVYGICKKCNLVLISDLFICQNTTILLNGDQGGILSMLKNPLGFLTQEEEPVQGVDFVVDYNKNVEGKYKHKE